MNLLTLNKFKNDIESCTKYYRLIANSNGTKMAKEISAHKYREVLVELMITESHMTLYFRCQVFG